MIQANTATQETMIHVEREHSNALSHINRMVKELIKQGKFNVQLPEPYEVEEIYDYLRLCGYRVESCGAYTRICWNK